MNESEEMLHRRVDEVLYYQWDPIGISKSAWSREEYQSYLPMVFKLLLLHDTATDIADYLNTISTQAMGLNSNIEHDSAIAEFLIELKEVYLQ